MRVITDRGKSILIELLNNDVVTLKYLEEKIHFSKRTILKDLDIIEKIVSEYEVKLVRKPNKGLWLCGTKENMANLHRVLNLESDGIPSTSEERQAYILTRLLDSDKYITIQELADEIYVSTGTIRNEIIKISENFNQGEIELEKKQNKGMRINGKEKDIRRVYANIITKQKDIEYMLNVINDFEAIDDQKNMHNKLKDMLEKEYIEKISLIARNLEEDLGYSFSDTAFTSLVIHIVIAIRRIKDGKQIKSNEIALAELSKYDEYQIALNLVNDIEKSFNIEIPKEEVGYITMHILGAKICKMGNLDCNVEQIIVDTSLKEVIKDMISKAEEVVEIKLADNKELFDGLLIHVRPSINRLINNMTIKNPYLDEIKRKYPIAFEAALKSFDVIREKYLVKANEDEIAYIALHIQASLENYKLPNENEVNVLVVCSTGMGTSQLISAKLKRLFPNINIVGVLSAINLENNPLIEKVDFIISSVPLYLRDISIIKVNPFLEDSDIEKIKERVNIVDINKKINYYKGFSNIFRENLVFLNREPKNKEQAISEICMELEEQGYTTKDYKQTVINRENISSTSYDGISIPHGDVKEVLKPFIAICTLSKPLKWGDNYVNVIFLIGVNQTVKHILSDIFTNLYGLLEDKERLKKILSCNNAKEVIEIVSR